MSSPLDKLKNKPVAPVAPVATAVPVPSMVPAVAASSPLAKMPKTANASLDLRNQYRLPVCADQLDQMSGDLAKNIGTTTDKITKTFTTATFGELGDMLYKVKTQANSLSADDLTKTGLIGWVRRKTTDIKAVLVKRFETASAAFDDLESKMVDQRTILQVWETDMEKLYDENYQNYLALREILSKAENAFNQNKSALENFPLIVAEDPDAFMKAQLLEEAKAEQNDISITCDTIRRQIIMCEHNGPDLRNRIRQSESQRKAITRVINEVIPLVKREFAKFLQTMEMQKSIQLVDGARDMGDQALRISADSSRDAAIATAKSVNAPVVSTGTIDHIRTRAIEALNAVSQIEQQAESDRAAFAVKSKQDQADYLKQLQQHKAI